MEKFVSISHYLGGILVLLFDQTVRILAHDAFRNAGLLSVAIVTLIFAARRLKISEEDKKTSIRQADVSEAGLNIDRFQKGSAMLGDDRLSVRQAGIIMLSELAQQNMHEYFDATQKIICLFIKEQTEIQLRDSGFISIWDDDFNLDISTDNQFAISALSRLIKSSLKDNNIPPVKCDLRHANLRSADLNSACLVNLNLNKAVLDNADLIGADLSHANLTKANIRETVLLGTLLYHANLFETDFLGTRFAINDGLNVRIPLKTRSEHVIQDPNGKYNAKGLTRFQLSQANNVETRFLNNLTDDGEKRPYISYGYFISEVDKFATKIIETLNQNKTSKKPKSDDKNAPI